MSTDYTKATPRRASAVPRDEFQIDHPPRGIKLKQEYDGGTVIKIPLFSHVACGYLAFALIWNGFVYLMGGNTISAAVAKLGISVKIPCIIPDGDGPPLWFILIFAVIGLWLVFFSFFYLFGKCEIRLGAGEGSVFKGVGLFGRTQRFTQKFVKSVGICITGYHASRRSGYKAPIYNLVIEMDNGRKIIFSHLGKTREKWLALALEKILGLPSRETPNPQT